ncbi:MAG: ribokinase [Clostridia bacterium]|nr:ribokinase [Clostridia bacterium]
MTKVLVVGSINVDYVIGTDRLPVLGETIVGKGFSMNFGGKGANQAVALARAGCSVTMLGAVGEDHPGELALEHLKACGIDPAGVSRVPGPTGAAVITVCGGNNHIILDEGANGKVTPAYVAEREDLFAKADVIVMQYEIPMESIVFAAKLAKKHGKPVVLNPAPAKDADPELFGYVDLVIPNEFETKSIVGIEPKTCSRVGEAVVAFRRMGCRNVVITLGVHGCAYTDDDAVCFAGIYPVKAVDSTAAGDSFIGGLCAKLGEGCDIRDAIAYASAVSAITVSRPGAGASIPDAAETEEFLKHSVQQPCTLPEGE